MIDPPQTIRSHRDAGTLELAWADGASARLPFRFLRGECPCAACVDEMTGVRTLDVNSLPLDVRPEKFDFVGNYALRIRWSDRHDTGLFTWEKLRELGGQSPPSA